MEQRARNPFAANRARSRSAGHRAHTCVSAGTHQGPLRLEESEWAIYLVNPPVHQFSWDLAGVGILRGPSRNPYEPVG